MHQVACDLASAIRVSRKHGREAARVDWIGSNRNNLTDPEAATSIRNELRGFLTGADPGTELAAASASVREDLSQPAVMIGATPTVFGKWHLADGDDGVADRLGDQARARPPCRNSDCKEFVKCRALFQLCSNRVHELRV